MEKSVKDNNRDGAKNLKKKNCKNCCSGKMMS